MSVPNTTLLPMNANYQTTNMFGGGNIASSVSTSHSTINTGSYVQIQPCTTQQTAAFAGLQQNFQSNPLSGIQAYPYVRTLPAADRPLQVVPNGIPSATNIQGSQVLSTQHSSSSVFIKSPPFKTAGEMLPPKRKKEYNTSKRREKKRVSTGPVKLREIKPKILESYKNSVEEKDSGSYNTVNNVQHVTNLISVTSDSPEENIGNVKKGHKDETPHKLLEYFKSRGRGRPKKNVPSAQVKRGELKPKTFEGNALDKPDYTPCSNFPDILPVTIPVCEASTEKNTVHPEKHHDSDLPFKHPRNEFVICDVEESEIKQSKSEFVTRNAGECKHPKNDFVICDEDNEDFLSGQGEYQFTSSYSDDFINMIKRKSQESGKKSKEKSKSGDRNANQKKQMEKRNRKIMCKGNQSLKERELLRLNHERNEVRLLQQPLDKYISELTCKDKQIKQRSKIKMEGLYRRRRLTGPHAISDSSQSCQYEEETSNESSDMPAALSKSTECDLNMEVEVSKNRSVVTVFLDTGSDCEENSGPVEVVEIKDEDSD